MRQIVPQLAYADRTVAYFHKRRLTPNGTPVIDQWSWSHGRRLDATIALDAVVNGNAILRLEGGVGRLEAETHCFVQSVSASCDQVAFRPDHGEWRGFVQLAVAVRPGRWSKTSGDLPLLVGVGRRLADTDEQIEGLVGVGPAVGSFSVADYSAFGLGAEIDFNYVRPLGVAAALVAGVSARAISFSKKFDGGQIATSGVHLELPVRIGVRILL